MIRYSGKTLAVAIALLLESSAGLQQARAQYGFVDDTSHVPPSPAGPVAGSRMGTIAVGTPSPSVTAPPQSSSAAPLSPAYSLSRIPSLSPRQGSSSTTAATPAAGSRAPFGKVGPYGVGGRRPDSHQPDAVRHVTPRNTDVSNRVTPLGKIPVTGSVTQTHFDKVPDNNFMQPVPQAVPDMSATPAPLFGNTRSPLLGPGSAFPTERLHPPTIMGNHLGLLPGETATERSLRLMTAIGELERQGEGLSQQNAELVQQVKQRDEQLLLAIRELKSTRKEVAAAREELERLRQQVKALQDKVHDADRDNAALLQTMAPLLQKLLETDRVDPPTEDPLE